MSEAGKSPSLSAQLLALTAAASAGSISPVERRILEIMRSLPAAEYAYHACSRLGIDASDFAKACQDRATSKALVRMQEEIRLEAAMAVDEQLRKIRDAITDHVKG